MNKTVISFIIVLFTSSFITKAQIVKIEIKTELGSIIAELYPEKAPVTCANFLKYIQNNKFAGATFYRVVRPDNQPQNKIKIEVIQGGLEFSENKFQYPPIIHETTNKTGILHKDGTLSMARNEPGSACSEFFICIGDQPELDFGGKRNPDGQGFSAFGKVVQGMDVVKKIQQLKDKQQMLEEQVKIQFVSVLGEQN